MTLFVADPDFTLHVGEVREVLSELPDESVHCCVTSPPYWGLRDYGTGEWDGGDPDCDHKPENARRGIERRSSTLGGGVAHLTAQEEGANASDACSRCGARRIDQQIGLEPTPEAYVATMVDVFREVRRVLRRDGTLWLNLGDSYNSNPSWGRGRGTLEGRPQEAIPSKPSGGWLSHAKTDELKTKDLVGIPWRVAFALQADGWYLRSDIIWSKPNPMPESVTDRPTKAHEYLFLMTRSPRYFYDADAIREDYTPDNRLKRVHDHAVNGSHENHQAMNGGKERWAHSGRNKRSVWEIATLPYPDAHFATFPAALVDPCIKAGCPAGGTVLDPFMGSGTTALVARRLGRKSIGIELNPEYAKLAAKRLQQLSLLADAEAVGSSR